MSLRVLVADDRSLSSEGLEVMLSTVSEEDESAEMTRTKSIYKKLRGSGANGV